MHRNHAYMRRKISNLAEMMKNFIDVSAQDKFESEGKMLSSFANAMIEEIQLIQFAATETFVCDEQGNIDK